MKESLYNYLIEDTERAGRYILFNGLTKALLTLTPEEKEIVENIFQDPNDTNIGSELRECLMTNEFIISDDKDELKYIKYEYLNLVYNKHELSLTVLPTLQCNFNCMYCYQQRSRKFYREQNLEECFEEKVKERIYKLVHNKIEYGVKIVRIVWYGGEPTVSMEQIIEITQHIGDICKENDVDFWINITSNGYLLTEENVRQLTPYLGGVTITVDGPKEVHDSRRMHYGESTYDVILNNIKKMQEIDENISINLRVTIDKSNIDSTISLLDDLQARNIKNLSIRYRSLYADPKHTPDLYKLVYSDEEMANIIPQLIREAIKRGLLVGFSPTPGSFMRCNAPSRNSLVIMPDGKLHKCWGDVGTKECVVGELNEDGKEIFNDKVMEWLTYNPLDKQECYECKLLPICMGECCYNEVVAKMRKTPLQRSNAGCSLFKYNFNEFLSLYTQIIESTTNRDDLRGE